MIGNVDNRALIGGGTAALGLAATASGFQQVREGKTYGETAKGIATMAFGVLAGIGSVYAFSQSDLTQDYFPTSFLDQVPTWEKAEQTVFDTASRIKENTLDKIPCCQCSIPTNEEPILGTSPESRRIVNILKDPPALIEANTAIGKGSTEKCIEALKKFPTTGTIWKIANALGGIEKFCSLPVLEMPDGQIPEYFIINLEDMKAPLMRGQDTAQRPFLAMHTIGTLGKESYDGIETIFQRYKTDDPNIWVSAAPASALQLVQSHMQIDEFKKLAQLASGEETDLNRAHTPIKKDLGSIHLADK